MAELKVWTDGSCLNNGTDKACCAIGVYYGVDDGRNYSSHIIGKKQTNNRAELIAILYAVIMDFNVHHLTIYSDSSYSISCVTQYWKKWEVTGWVTSKGTPVESSEIIRSIVDIIQKRAKAGAQTQLIHVKAHADDAGNVAADALARRASLMGTEGGKIKLLRLCGQPV